MKASCLFGTCDSLLKRKVLRVIASVNNSGQAKTAMKYIRLAFKNIQDKSDLSQADCLNYLLAKYGHEEAIDIIDFRSLEERINEN